MNISFGGATIKRPGSYSVVDTAGMVPIKLGAFNVLAVVGVPNETNTLDGKIGYFNDPGLAKEAVGASEMLDLMNIAWQHGADLIAAVPVKGTGGAPADADWDKAIDLMKTEFIDGVVPATSEATVHAKFDTHITSLSSVTNRKERRGFYGHKSGLTTAAITGLQTALNTERGIMATPGVYYPDATGELVLKDSHYLAAAYAGIWASQAPQEPITYKYVKFAKLEKNYDQPEIAELLEGHIAPTEYVRGKGFRIVQGVTLSADEDLTKQELSVSTLKDVMSRNMREYFEEKYVGKAGVAGVEVTIQNDLVSLIGKFQENGWISGYEADSVRVVKNGTAFSLAWEGHATLPMNNFLITSHFTL